MRKLAVLFLFGSLMGCATWSNSDFASIGTVDLPDGSRLRAVKAQVDTFSGTDTNVTMVWHCPPPGKGNCTKSTEFGGASASLLKAAMHGAGAGAAIGAGYALQDADQTNVNAYGGGATGGRSTAVANQFQEQTQTTMPMMPGGGD